VQTADPGSKLGFYFLGDLYFEPSDEFCSQTTTSSSTTTAEQLGRRGVPSVHTRSRRSRRAPEKSFKRDYCPKLRQHGANRALGMIHTSYQLPFAVVFDSLAVAPAEIPTGLEDRSGRQNLGATWAQN
jgi:hypothetical protein